MSLIDERGEKSVRMANLATVASHTVNGVAALHSRLLDGDGAQRIRANFPAKIHERDERRYARGAFLGLANPGLTNLINEAIGDSAG